MSNLQRLLAGRKRESSVWQYFNFAADVGKSRCIVMKGGKECGVLIAGKNPTNLKKHLESFHRDIADEVDKQDTDTKSKRSDVQRSVTVNGKYRSQTLSECFNRKLQSWPRDSREHKTRIDALVNVFISTGYPLTFVDDPAFRKLLIELDPKFAIPGSATVNKQLQATNLLCVQRAKELLYDAQTQGITICLDGWSKKGLTASYLGISACFYDRKRNKTLHIMLSLDQLQHPYTGENLRTCLHACLEKWALPAEKILLIVSDSGANIVKAIRLLQEEEQEKRRVSEDAESDEENDPLGNTSIANSTTTASTVANESERDDEANNDDDDDEEEEDEEYNAVELPEDVPYKRLPCMVHSLQLVVKQGISHNSVSNLITKAKTVVSTLRRSSLAMEKLVASCGKVVVADCITRWNSTYYLCKRLVEIRQAVGEALNAIGADGLLASEWNRLEDLIALLEPFTVQTKILQTDSMSLSTAVPSLLELECHLQQGTTLVAVRKAMREKFKDKFDCVLNTENPSFIPHPAAACLLDPTLATILLKVSTPRVQSLMEIGKHYILQHQEPAQPTTAEDSNNSRDLCPLSLKKFKFLSSQFTPSAMHTVRGSNSNMVNNNDQLDRYLMEVGELSYAPEPFEFWKSRLTVYNRLVPLAMNLLSAPATQAYVERVFSLCGYLTAGRRNRMGKNLQMRAFLKMNKCLLDD